VFCPRHVYGRLRTVYERFPRATISHCVAEANWKDSSRLGAPQVSLAILTCYRSWIRSHRDGLAQKSRLSQEFLVHVEVFGYRSPTVVRDIISAFKNRTIAGAFAIGSGLLKNCIEVISACKGRKLIAQARVDLPREGLPKSMLEWLSFGISIGCTAVSTGIKSKLRRVGTKFIWGSNLMANEVGSTIYETFCSKYVTTSPISAN
jgi:hypothetical protein